MNSTKMNANQQRLAECILAILESEAYETVVAGDQTLTPQDLRELAPRAAQALIEERLPQQTITSMSGHQYTQTHLALEDLALQIANRMDQEEKQELLDRMTGNVKHEMLSKILVLSRWLNEEDLMQLVCEIMEENRSEDPLIAEQVSKTLREHQPSDTLMLLIEREKDRFAENTSVDLNNLEDYLKFYDDSEQLAQEADAEMKLMALGVVESALGTERRDQAESTLLVLRGFMPLEE